MNIELEGDSLDVTFEPEDSTITVDLNEELDFTFSEDDSSVDVDVINDDADIPLNFGEVQILAVGDITVEVRQTETGCVITATDPNGSETAVIHHGRDGVNGRDGRDGQDGYTPVKGFDYFDGRDGRDGQDGSPGRDGVDGYTPVKGVDYFDGLPGRDGADGSPGEAGPQGPPGYTPVKGVDYFDGVDGAPGRDGDPGPEGPPGRDGSPGVDGRDGLTPYIGPNDHWFIGEIDTGVRALGVDGEDGYTPVKGVDYFDGAPGEKGDPGYTPQKNVDYFDGAQGPPGPAGADGYTPQKGVDYFTSADIAIIVESAVNQTLKTIAPYNVEFNNGKLYAPATSATYTPTSVSEHTITFTYRGGSGVEELIFPITGLFPGRTYTLVFDETYNGGYINDAYYYGCGIVQKSVYDSTKYPTSLAKPSYVTWNTASTGKQTGAITFTAQADTVYWIWSLGRIQDSVNHTITMNARVY